MRHRLQHQIRRRWRVLQSDWRFGWEQRHYAGQLARLRSQLTAVDQRVVADLSQTGVAVTSLAELAVPETEAFWQAAQALMAELRSQPAIAPRPRDRQNAFSHAVPADPVRIATTYPVLFTWGLGDRLLNILETYIAAPVACQGVNLRRDVVDGQQIGTRFWHRDGEDRHVIKIIVYLTDVDAAAGPFEYIPKAQSPAYRQFKAINYQISDADMAKVVPADQWVACMGSAGTVILTDTAKIFHHGRVPETERVAVFFAYTSQQPRHPELCSATSFHQGLPYLQASLTPRQQASLWSRR